MKPTSRLIFSTLTLTLTWAGAAPAALNPTLERGERNVYLTSPGGVQEVCVMPRHYPGVRYQDEFLRSEEKLCSYSFYDVSEGDLAAGFESVATCAKTNSTNPGVDIFFVNLARGQSKASIEAARCEGADKIMKYKNSTSCSYTPSILGYYHMSQILGGIGRVPPSVLRTMDRNTHLALARQGVARTRPADLIHKTWSGLLSILTAGAASSKKDLVLTEDARQSYGALIQNPSDEVMYRALFNSGADRAAAFRDNNAYFRLVRDRRPLSQLVSASWTQDNVQKLFAMRDVTEFIVLDHILDQQDRFGNIAAQQRLVYFKKQDDGSIGLTLEKSLGDYQRDLQAGVGDNSKAPVTISSMLLKDNDCGVSKSNVVKAAGLLRLVAHMSSQTYHKLLALQGSVVANKSFFTENLLFTETDYREMVANLNDAVNILKTNCRSGALQLDLNLEEYLSTGRSTAGSCE